MCGWGLAAHQKEGERFCVFSVKMEHLLCAPERDQLKASGAGRQELKAAGRWVARGRCAPDLSSLSPFLVSSLYFLLKKQQKDGEKKTTRTKRKKTQHKTNDGFYFESFFFSFFANGKKMGCPRHRGSSSLHTSRCPQPSGCQTLPDIRLHLADATALPRPPPDVAGRGALLHWSCSRSSRALRRWPEELGEWIGWSEAGPTGGP